MSTNQPVPIMMYDVESIMDCAGTYQLDMFDDTDGWAEWAARTLAEQIDSDALAAIMSDPWSVVL